MSERKKQAAGSGRVGLLTSIIKRLGERTYLTREALVSEAAERGLSLGEVYGTASFYSLLPVTAKGKYVIRVCRCVPCDMKNAPDVIDAVRNELGIGPGETTADGLFSLELVGCMGACDRAPAMMINDELHGELDARKIKALLRSLAK